MNKDLSFDVAAFNTMVSRTREMLHRNGRSYVRTTARRLVRRLAYNTPMSKENKRNKGRLRAGFWPAAQALGITNIYTRFPNKNEGGVIDNTASGSNPSFTIINSVPYMQNLRMGYQWIENAKRGVQAQMTRDLEKYVVSSWRRESLIDDLSAE